MKFEHLRTRTISFINSVIESRTFLKSTCELLQVLVDDSRSQVLLDNYSSLMNLFEMMRNQLKNDLKVVLPNSIDPQYSKLLPSGLYLIKIDMN